MNTIQIHLPPLRERPEDIEVLADHFLKLYSRKYNKPVLELKEDALAKLKRNAWPGNIRELQHTIEKAVILADSSNLKAADFVFFENDSEIVEPGETLEEMEKKMIIRTLKRNNYNQSLTADQLGVTRQTLYNKLKKYGI
jgi:transcriptional regulator with PAS, ATPase and Fis domain